jgi:hypothetical protein
LFNFSCKINGSNSQSNTTVSLLKDNQSTKSFESLTDLSDTASVSSNKTLSDFKDAENDLITTIGAQDNPPKKSIQSNCTLSNKSTLFNQELNKPASAMNDTDSICTSESQKVLISETKNRSNDTLATNSCISNQESLSLNKTASAMNDADSIWTSKSQPMKENIIKSDLSVALNSTTSNPKSFSLNKTSSAFKDADSVCTSKSQQILISENRSNDTLATNSCISNQESLPLNKTASAMNDADSIWTSKSHQSKTNLKKSNDFNSVLNFDLSTQLNQTVSDFSDSISNLTEGKSNISSINVSNTSQRLPTQKISKVNFQDKVEEDVKKELHDGLKPLENAKSKSNISFGTKKSNHSSISLNPSGPASSMSLTRISSSESEEVHLDKPVRQGYNKFEEDYLYIPVSSMTAIREETQNREEFHLEADNNRVKILNQNSVCSNEKSEIELNQNKIPEASTNECENFGFRASAKNSNFDFNGALVHSVKSLLNASNDSFSKSITKNDLPKIHSSLVRSRISQFQKGCETKSDSSMSTSSRFGSHLSRDSKTTASLISTWENSIKSKNSTITSNSTDGFEFKMDLKIEK